MTRFRQLTVMILGCLLVPAVMAGAQDVSGDALFQQAFGVSRLLDSAVVQEVMGLPAGERLMRDTNGDGAPDEQWYLDTDKRHTIQPLLVRVIDEDGDLAQDGRGDLDSDLYLFDWEADGVVDVVKDYVDYDGDNDVDAMGLFYDKRRTDYADSITVWWAIDEGDDNLLWYDVNGTYYQDLCQYRTHFSGDETFYQFELTTGTDEWLNIFEDPFAFYDPDGDTCSEEVVRICARGDVVENLRYSVDADGDAFGRRTHDYDFSITALPGDKAVETPGNITTPLEIRGIATHVVLPWDATRDYVKSVSWDQAMLTWDEINANTEQDVDKDPYERWEGIINHAAKDGTFPQVGGPPTSALNKRVEISDEPAAPLRLYYDAADRRIHLLGANRGYIDVDFDLDGQVDMSYTYLDDNGDGVFDRRTFDVDADGTPEFIWPMNGKGREFDVDYETIMPFYTKELEEVLASSQRFIDYAEGLLAEELDSLPLVKQFFLNEVSNWHPEQQLGERIRNTPAGARYYTDLYRDLLFWALHGKFGDSLSDWADVEERYMSGRYAEAAEQLNDMLALPAGHVGTKFSSFTDRLDIVLDNTGKSEHANFPVVLDVAALKTEEPGFNPANCAVLAPERWLDWREVPHQVDSFNLAGVEQVTFLAHVPADTIVTYYLVFDPNGTRQSEFPKLTHAVLDNPAYVAWESEYGAFRFYTGQFDFFGKQVDRNIPKTERLIYPLIEVDYHAQQDWGIDALHVGTTSGLGGLNLVLDGETYLVQSPANKGQVAFEYKALGSGPVRAVTEIAATNVVPERPEVKVRLLCTVYAEHQESQIETEVVGVDGETDLTPGLMYIERGTAFADEDKGLAGSWGYQGEDIGEIGLGVIVPPAALESIEDAGHEQRLVCNASGHGLTYWIIGDWRRGRQYAVSAGPATWRWELEQLANRLQSTPRVKVNKPRM
ncbi:MAG: DUF4861 family protein [Candidatus Hydrogenedentes bacterium]|nr:DUF4861 family protein [Candidatus Hydrogenedentota bacterium]